MIKVVHILPVINHCEAKELVFNLCQYSKKTDPSVIVLQNGITVEEFQKAKIPILVMGDIHNRYEKYAKTLEILRKADIINVHFLRDESLYMIHWLVKESGLPYLFTVHCQFKLPLLDCMICCTARCIEAIQAKGNKCTIIPSGIDLSKFSYQSKGKRKDNKIIITLITDPHECAPYFWFAMNDVLKANPDAELWILGDRQWSAKQIKSFGAEGDIRGILAQTDIFSYAPYPRRGSIENAVLQAMAMDVPSVLSNVEWTKEIIEHEKEGLLVPYGDRKAFAEAVNILISNHDYRKKLGRNAFEKVKKFDVVDTALQYDRLYKLLLNSK